MARNGKSHRRPLWRAVFDRVDLAPIGAAEKERLNHYSVFVVLGAPTLAAFGLLNLLRGNILLAAMIALIMVGVIAGWLMLLRLPDGRVVYRIVAGLYFTLVLYMVALSDPDGSKRL